MVCPNCGTLHSLSDNFCRRCGWNLSGASVPAVIDDNARAILPYSAERALAVGSVATFAVGALAWLVKQWLAARVNDPPVRNLPAVTRRAPAPPAQARAHSSEHVHIESYVWFRRIITFRRDQD